MKPCFRPLFLAGVEQIADDLCSEVNAQAAEQFRATLKRTVSKIAYHPEIGRIRGDLPLSGIRTCNVKGFADWLVFYRLEKERLEFLCVKHGMMHLPDLFESAGPTG